MNAEVETPTRATPETTVLVSGFDDVQHDRLVAGLGGTGCRVTARADGSSELLAAVRDQSFDVVLVDADCLASSDPDVFRRMHEQSVDLGGLLVTASPEQLDAAKEALRLGAADYLVKPCDVEQILATLRLVATNRRLERANRDLSARLQGDEQDDTLVGCSPAARRLAGVVERAGASDATVLIEGRAGTGKSLLARLIHRDGPRADRALLTLESDELAEDALRAALDDESIGTIVLENVDRLAQNVQSRLVRAFKERSSPSRAASSPRVIATTAAKLAELTARGRFREDLYYRLNVFPITVPSLQERREDISPLAAHFLAQSAASTGVPDRGLTPGAMILLETHPWPGNVAQLKNTIFRAHALAGDAALDRVHLMGPTTGVSAPPGVQGLTDGMPTDERELTEDDVLPFQEEEKRILTRALRATKGNVRRAAQLLGIGRATLYRKIQVYQLRLQ